MDQKRHRFRLPPYAFTDVSRADKTAAGGVECRDTDSASAASVPESNEGLLKIISEVISERAVILRNGPRNTARLPGPTRRKKAVSRGGLFAWDSGLQKARYLAGAEGLGADFAHEKTSGIRSRPFLFYLE